MAKSPYYKGNNAGGYGNPPIEHQFTGTPGPGRPKGSTSMTGAVRKAFGRKIKKTNKQGEVVEQVPAVDALAERALQLGLTGSVRANEIARQLAAELEPDRQPIYADYSALNSAEIGLLVYLIEKMMGKDPASPDIKAYLAIEELLENQARLYSDEIYQVYKDRMPTAIPKPIPFDQSYNGKNPNGVRKYDDPCYFDDDA